VKAAIRGLAERAYARHIQRAAQERKRPRKSSSPGALPVQILSTSVDLGGGLGVFWRKVENGPVYYFGVIFVYNLLYCTVGLDGWRVRIIPYRISCIYSRLYLMLSVTKDAKTIKVLRRRHLGDCGRRCLCCSRDRRRLWGRPRRRLPFVVFVMFMVLVVVMVVLVFVIFVMTLVLLAMVFVIFGMVLLVLVLFTRSNLAAGSDC